MNRALFATLVAVLAWLVQGCGHFSPSYADSPSPTPTPSPAWAGSLQGGFLGGFQPSEQFERRGTFSISATNITGSVLKLERVTGLDLDSARRLTDDGVMSLEALYANALSPYPGDLSNRVVTDHSFQPKRAASSREPWFILFANDRFGFGASTREQVKYKALLGWIHCPQGEELIKVRLYVQPNTPDDTLKQWMKSLGCQELRHFGF